MLLTSYCLYNLKILCIGAYIEIMRMSAVVETEAAKEKKNKKPPMNE